ncbi:MAG: DUF1080 domain-containing protein [Planctomycetes bacterium]|nr:DUF1080 domain-containing protein [Planctomycetota bacterium]
MRLLSFTIFLLGLAALPFANLRAADAKAEKGFTSLFNGKNFDGWRERNSKDTLEGKTEAFKGRFKIVDGVIHYDPKVGGDKYIETIKEYAGDVHFKFDFNPGPKCNNDILFRGTKFDIIPGNKENKNVKEGEWSTFELIAKGDKIEHKINGETARSSTGKAKANTFVLRAEIGAMQVKNIRVKD